MSEVYRVFIDYGGRGEEEYLNREFLCVSVESAREKTVKIVNEDYMLGVDWGQENVLPLLVSISPLTANAEGILEGDRRHTKVLDIKDETICGTILDIINFFNQYHYEVFSMEERQLQ